MSGNLRLGLWIGGGFVVPPHLQVDLGQIKIVVNLCNRFSLYVFSPLNGQSSANSPKSDASETRKPVNR